MAASDAFIQIGGPAKDDPIVGIDLGTTNSLVAYVRDGQPEVLKSREGRTLVPSVVSIGVDGKPMVGYQARHEKVRGARNTIFSVKRLLGRGFEDLKPILAQLPYKIVAGPVETNGQNDSLPRIQIGDRGYTAIEVSAMILRELKLAAESALDQPVTRAVITVPAYFNDSQRQATRAAGRLAGWDVLRIINEPTAASLAYGLDRKKQGLIAVYDLGGGTFDISILKLHDGIFEVLSTHGDTALGGDDLDQAMASVMALEIREQHRVEAQSDPELWASVLEAAESAKIALSTETSALAKVDYGKVSYRREWTLEEFEALVRPILERTREACVRALQDAGLSASELSDVVMVGGPTRLPVVQAVAASIFGMKPNASVHPDEVVAAGAAIQADILAGKNRDFLLLDVVPLSLGLETYGGVMSTLISRNTRIPAVAREFFTTFVDNQTAVDLHILQGERERVEDNRSLARFKLRGIEPSPAGTPRIEVTFLIDADGILQVSAKDLKTGNEQAIEVKPSFGLTDSQVERMLLASAEHAVEDITYRQLVEARNQAEPVLRAAERKLGDARRLLSPEEITGIEVRIAELKSALQGTKPVVITEAKNALDQSTVKLAELVVKEIIANKSTHHSNR